MHWEVEVSQKKIVKIASGMDFKEETSKEKK